MGDSSETVTIIDRALELADVLRQNTAELHARCLQLERTVADRDRRLDEVLALMPMPVVATDRAAVVIEANANASSLLGRSTGRLRNDLLLHYAEDRARFSSIVQRLPSLSVPLDARLRIRPRERAPIDVNVIVAPDLRNDSGNYLWFFSRC